MKAFGHSTRVFALHFSQILENRFFLKCGHQKGTQYFRVVLCCYVAGSGSNVQIFGRILSCNGQIKATEQYFTVVLFIMLYKLVLTFRHAYVSLILI